MKGTHRNDQAAREDLRQLKPGEYVYRPGLGWFACTPNGHLADLSMHDCEFNKADNVLSVHPSIAVSTGEGQVYHGYLENGVWRDA